MVQDFKGWLGFSFEIVWGENGKKMGRREWLQLALLHSFVERNNKLAILKWTAAKTHYITSQNHRMAEVGRDTGYHPVQRPYSGQGQLEHVAGG